MSTTHSLGVLAVLDNRQNKFSEREIYIVADGGLTVATVAYQITHHGDADRTMFVARRIVSCANAMDGLPQDALDGGWTAAGICAHAKRLEGINAELLAALETLVKRIEFYSSMREDERPNMEQWEYTEGSTDMAKARAAIATATGAA